MMVKSAVVTLIESDPRTICFYLQCPEGTVLCGKRSEVSSVDSSKLNVEVQCYDDNGHILTSKNSTADNPYGPHVYYKGTKLSGIITIQYPFEDDEGVGRNSESDKIPKSKPQSEIDDLNSK
ncbi:hypothetical protein YQE_05860, partial [Dendroctonus ponderosae]